MKDVDHGSRRDFLSTSAKLAALAGVAAVGGCAGGQSKFDRGPNLRVKRGPIPRTIGPNDTIRFGLIGIGGQGRHDLNKLLQNDKISIVALADPDKKNQEMCLDIVKNATGETPEVYEGDEGYKKLLERDDVDAILSATPCYLHGPVYLACLQAGKHFYGEKPMCTEANEADALVEAQEKNPLVKGVIGFQRRASARYAEGIKMIQDGVFGSPVDGRGAWNNSWGPIGKPNEGPRIWLGRRELSGDWMLEQACHTWDVFNWVAGGKMPIAASGVGRRDLFEEMDPQRDVTDYYIAHLEYPENFSVDFEHSWICPHKDGGRFSGVFEYVSGLKGGIALNEGKTFWRDHKKEPGEVAAQDGDHIGQNIAAFLDSIRTGAPVLTGVHNGRTATYTGLLVRKAVDEQRWVSMDELM